MDRPKVPPITEITDLVDDTGLHPQSTLLEQIEALFAGAAPDTLRYTTRSLERMVRQIKDPALRSRYESAIDLLPDMVGHLDLGHGH